MIGTELKCLRLKKGVSQQKLADKLKISKGTILKIENNRSCPSWDITVKLLKELLPRYPNGRIDFRSLHKYFE